MKLVDMYILLIGTTGGRGAIAITGPDAAGW
jgi:hypothetical protein